MLIFTSRRARSRARSRRPLALFLLAVLLIPSVNPAAAGKRLSEWLPGHAPIPLVAQDGGRQAAEIRVSLDDAVNDLRSATGGRILSATTQWEDGAPVHRIKVLTKDRRVRVYYVDARTGRRR